MVSKVKKHYILFAFILFSFSALASDFSFEEELLNLNEEYKNLVTKENERFEEEEKNSELSKKRVENLYLVKEKIETELLNRKEERKKRFFKDDYDDLVDKYESYLKKVEKEIVAQEKMISDFELIKALRGE